MVDNQYTLDDVEKAVKSGKPVFAYFSGSILENGNSWCSDCDKAKAPVKEIFDTFSNEIQVFSFSIPRSEAKDASNQYKTHKLFKVTCVPTLLLFIQGVEATRLWEDHLFESKENIKLIRDLLDSN